MFVEQGVQRTSLRQIAERLGISKPALYYHFASRDDLVNSIIQPLIEDMEAFVSAREASAPGARQLLEEYFDLVHAHRDVINMMVRELSTLKHLDLGQRMFEWRRRIMIILLGDDPPLDRQIRAVVALGGMSDTTVEFVDHPIDDVRQTAVSAAMDALGGSDA